MFEKEISQASVAAQLHVTRSAVCQWHAAWNAKKKDGLLSKGKTGTPPKLNRAQRHTLKKIILSGPKKAGYATDFWTLERIKAVTKKKLKVALGTGSVWRTVIALGFSAQKPVRRAKERNEKAIADWKLKEFPKLKKMGA